MKRKPTKKASKSKRSTKRKSNPKWSWKSLFTGKTKGKGDSISILVEDGNIVLSGNELPENYRTLFSILDKEGKDLKIEFYPDDSDKSYVLNRPYNPQEGREKMRETLRSGEYGTMPRFRIRKPSE